MPHNLIKPRPTLATERDLLLRGRRLIAGVDEVGVGAIAGPLVAAAVILPLPDSGPDLDQALERLAGALVDVRDSKQLRGYEQERLYILVRELVGWHVGVGIVGVPELELIRNQMRAVEVATLRALEALPEPPDFALLDGKLSPDALLIPHASVAKVYNGTPSLSIAAASIVANVTYRRIMAGYAEIYPQYGFDRQAGYPSPAHLSALARHGPSPIHHRHNRIVRSAREAGDA